jgi:hypothetical protein
MLITRAGGQRVNPMSSDKITAALVKPASAALTELLADRDGDDVKRGSLSCHRNWLELLGVA